MTIPSPDLDDRRFQDLVDDAKRLVAARCPEWTDHNVSDPGVTLIETFAFMTDELLFRLNRVPDRLHIAFLELLGLQLRPASAASVELLFWLSAPQPTAVTVPQGTEASTARHPDTPATVFASSDDLEIGPRRLVGVLTASGATAEVDRQELLRGRDDVPAFSAKPAAGDVILFALDKAAPRLAIALRFDCSVSGVGVDPDYPPLIWEAKCGDDWVACELLRDETGGLNQRGDVVVLVPRRHDATTIAGVRAGWLRCRLLEPTDGVPYYSEPPRLHALSGFSIGGAVDGSHSETVLGEVLGLSEGVPGQEFALARRPVVSTSTGLVVEVASGSDWEEWSEVDSFAGGDAMARTVRVDRVGGSITFPPAVREQDGSLRQFGAIPPAGAPLRVRSYRTGGGPDGNVAPGAISILRTTIPFVLRVENRRAARGGQAAESVEEARVRAPLALRTRDRAVTAEDFEQLSLAVDPRVARIRAVPATTAAEAGGVRILVVPGAAPDQEGKLQFSELAPDAVLLEAITRELDARRLVGTRISVGPPVYRGITVVASVSSSSRYAAETVRTDALRALNDYLNPISGGPAGGGWPFGRPVYAGDVHAVLQHVRGIELVDEVLLFAADPITGKRGEAAQRIELGEDSLVFSFEHRVRVTMR